MSESKLKLSALIKVDLTPSQRVTLNSILNYVRRCGACGTNTSQGENELQIKRYNQILNDLDLYVVDDLTQAEQIEWAKKIDVESNTYTMKLEAARHLQSVLDKKLKFNPAPFVLTSLVEQLEAQIPKSASELDEEATATEKSPLAKFAVSVSPEEREYLLSVFFTPVLCLGCNSITDGIDSRKSFHLLSSTFRAFKLDEFYDKTGDEIKQICKENSDPVDYEINIDQATFLHGLVFRRIGFVPKAPRKLARFTKTLEDIKSGSYDRKVETKPVIEETTEAVQEKEKAFPSASA